MAVGTVKSQRARLTVKIRNLRRVSSKGGKGAGGPRASGSKEAECVRWAGEAVTLGPPEHLLWNPSCTPRAMMIWVCL